MKTEIIILCKYRGKLVLAVFSKTKDGISGKCPSCLSEQFQTYKGWIECSHCDFALLEEGHSKALKEVSENEKS